MNIGEDITPDPVNLLQTNRNIGYDITEAIADLIDNSISAKSTFIDLRFEWNDGFPSFAIVDNGVGMDGTTGELVNAFKLATKSPVLERSEDDLGRYGSGLKTASLSQSRSFIVISKTAHSKVCARALDLDFIQTEGKGWRLKIISSEDYSNFREILETQGHGTVVIWDKWDRFPANENDFHILKNKVEEYVSICFHRFIESNAIKIFRNGTSIMPVSPIPKEIASPATRVVIHDGAIVQKAFILPHPAIWPQEIHSDLNINSYNLLNGYANHQGIYVYRCNRLLNPYGGWLGVIKAQNSTKLARVVIEFSNSVDSLWSIDITKTKARIPFILKKEIDKFLHQSSRDSTKKIIRGNKEYRDNISNNGHTIWRKSIAKDSNFISYNINTEHSLFDYNNYPKGISRVQFKELLRLIGTNLPVAEIIESNDHNPSSFDFNVNVIQPFELDFARQLYQTFRFNQNSHFEALSKLFQIEPFTYFQEEVKNYIENDGR
jgi:hypothetical protein